MRKLKTFLRLRREERLVVMKSLLLLPLITLLLRAIGLARCWALLRWTAGGRTNGVARGDPAWRGRTVQLVDVAARNLPWQPSCLPRSLVLWFLLRRRGVPAELRIGVQKFQHQLKAHAWVEVDHRVVNDAPDIAAEYPPFPSIAEALRVTP